MKNLQYINVFTFVHFILWFMIGILYPNRYGSAVALSFLWEINEGYSVQHSTMYPLLQQYWIIPEKYWNLAYYQKTFTIFCIFSMEKYEFYGSPYHIYFF